MKSAVAVVMAIVLSTGVCQAQSFQGPRELLRLEWEVGQTKRGRPIVTGYIYNQHDFRAANIQLLVEGFDSSGRRVSKTVGYVDDDVPPGERAYFEVPVPTAGTTYRVVLLSFDWFMHGFVHAP